MIFGATDLLATFLIYFVGYSIGGIIIGFLIYRFIKSHSVLKAGWVKTILLVAVITVIIGVLLLQVL
jgi:hypothetical protein